MSALERVRTRRLRPLAQAIWPPRRDRAYLEGTATVATLGVLAALESPSALVFAIVLGALAWSRLEDLTIDLESFDAAIALLDARLDRPRDVRQRASLQRAYQRALDDARRRFGDDDRRTAAATMLVAHACLRLHGREAALATLARVLAALAHADAPARRWGVTHVVRLDLHVRELRLAESRFDALWEAIAGHADAQVQVAMWYAQRLSKQGDLSGARMVLARAELRLREPSVGAGSPFRIDAATSDAAALRRDLSLLMAAAWTAEGDLAAAWEVARDVEVGTDVAVLIAVTGYEYDAGNCWRACERLRVALAHTTGEERSTVALRLAARLYDLGAVAASRAFLAEVPVDGSPEPAYRCALQAELDGDGTVPRPWSAEPALALVALAQAAHLRGDPGALELADLAVAQFQDARADHPHVSDAFHVRAGILAAAGRRDDARHDLYRAITIVGARCGAEHPQLVKLLTRLLELEHGDRAERIRLRLAALRVAHRFEDLEAMRPGPADAPPPT